MTFTKFIIITGLFYGSIYLFTLSQKEINKVLINDNCNNTNIYKIYILNGTIMLFSGLTFAYFSTKLLNTHI